MLTNITNITYCFFYVFIILLIFLIYIFNYVNRVFVLYNFIVINKNFNTNFLTTTYVYKYE